MRTVFAYDKLLEVASRGFDRGATMRTATTMEWNIAGRCENPVFRSLSARPTPTRWNAIQHLVRPATKLSIDGRRDIDFWTRCRKCGPCLRMRSSMWRYRAKNEVAASARTWFVTLTLNPQHQFMMLLRASARLEAQGVDWETLTPERQFAERHVEASAELTKWLKRVRNESGAPLRYCLVAEAHKSGLPHYHALIHEVDVNRPVRARTLRKQWCFGFSKVSLVAEGDEGKSASYVTKYLAKSAISRVRASLGYGHPSPSSSNTPFRHSSQRERKPPLTPQEKDAIERQFILPVEASEPSSFRSWDAILAAQRGSHHRRGIRGYGGNQ